MPNAGLRASTEPLPSSPPPETKPRLNWIDTAKAASILLVVSWHTLGPDYLLNQALIFARMPLFFFAAGLFAAKALQKPRAWVFKNRTLSFFYLYAIWIGITFAATTVVECIRTDHAIEWDKLTLAFIRPYETLWFLYALGLVFALGSLFRGVHHRILLSASLVLYCISVSDADWSDISLLDRIVRLTPFFVVGAVYSANVRRFIERSSVLSLAFAAIYAGVVWSIQAYELMWFGPLTIIASALGILTICTLSVNVQQVPPVAQILNFIGQRTILIYVLHRIVIYYARPIWSRIGLGSDASDIANFFVGVAVALPVGLFLQKHVPLLFEAPWVGKIKRPSNG
ncbi:hypothetical protein DMC47_28085 [Nostoc sp. 3335mG]|nr:hypothetical protein DMC47_28085 [Nostoc sp. 3335mG]